MKNKTNDREASADTETDAHFCITRRQFIQSSAAASLSASTAGAAHAGNGGNMGDELDLLFEYREGRRKVKVTVLFQNPEGEELPWVPSSDPIEWTVDARRFGPDAYFTFLDRTSGDGPKRYELRIRNGQFGELRSTNLVFQFQQRKDPVVGKLRFSILAEIDFFRLSDTPFSFVMEDYGNPFGVRRDETFLARLRSRPRRAPRPGIFRDFAKNMISLVQYVRADVVAPTFDVMFNGLIKYRSTKGTRNEVIVSLGQDIVWTVAPRDVGRSGQLYIASVLLPLEETRFGWMMPYEARTGKIIDPDTATEDTAPKNFNPTKLQLYARASRATNARFDLFGGTGPTVWLSQTAASEEGATASFILRRDDSRSDGASRAEATLPGIFEIDIADNSDPENRAGPFPDIAARLLLRADKTRGQDAIVYSLSFDGDFNTTKAYRVETPIGPVVLRGPSLSPELETGNNNRVERRPRAFLDPFAPRWDQGVSIVWSQAQSSDRQLDWIEINTLLLEHSAALPDAQYSRLTFEPTDLRILWAPADMLDDSASLVSLLRLGPRDQVPGNRINLSRAKLRASRTHDLLSLQFRFSDLWLSYPAVGSPLLVKTNPACFLPAVNGSRDSDPRPVIVVDFPGQHLFEEAVFLPKPEPLPDTDLEWSRGELNKTTGELTQTKDDPPPVLGESDDVLILDLNSAVQVDEALRRLSDFSARRTFRSALNSAKSLTDADFNAFQDRYGKAASGLAKRFKLPEDQWIYIGNLGLDVDARALALNVQRDLVKENAEGFVRGMIGRVGNIHASIVSAAEVAASPSPEDQAVRNRNVDVASALVMEGLLEQAVPAYQLLRSFYRDVMIDRAVGGGAPQDGVATKPADTSAENVELSYSVVLGAVPNWLPVGLSQVEWRQRYEEVLNAFIVEVVAQSEKEQIARQTHNGLVEGRLANPSRLAFRVDCPDWTQLQRATTVTHLDAPEDAMAQVPRRALEFTLKELTNFSNFELSVTQRAERIYTSDEAGRRDRLSRRTLNVSPGAMLDHLGFHQGPFVNSSTRLADIQSVLKEPPGPFQTAIEIPARLVLSPHQDAVVVGRNTGRVPDSIFVQDERTAPNGIALWSADFLIDAEDPGVRAVHSPDLRSAFLWGRQYGNRKIEGSQHIPATPPPRGPFAPWFSGQGSNRIGTDTQELVGTGPVSASDLRDIGNPLRRWNLVVHAEQKSTVQEQFRSFCRKLLVNSPTAPAVPDQKFRGGIDAFMRHELVLLSSGWGLPVMGRRSVSGAIESDASQFEPEPRHRLVDVEEGSALYQPRPLDVSELSLSALGGSLRHDSSFEPPAAALSKLDQRSLFNALSIERWQQWTVLSRDVFSEVTFKGFLFPLGHRAALVQVTEREFLRAPDCSIRAYLRQRIFIRLGKPEKRFPAISQPFEGRMFPVERLRILTTKTPDIMDPASGEAREDNELRIDARGRLNLPNKSALAFWPRTAPLQEANVRFEMEVDGSKTDLPLMFVDNVAANDRESLSKIVEYYNSEVPTPDAGIDALGNRDNVDPIVHMRTLQFQGEKRRYTPEVKAGSASLETDHWTLAASGRRNGAATSEGEGVGSGGLKVVVPDLTLFDSNPLLQGADQPPFYPQVDVARVRLRQAERLVGRTVGPVRGRFDANYLRSGFPEVGSEAVIEGNASEVFLNLLQPDQKLQDMGKKGDQSGGVFRPSGRMIAVSRAKGVLSSDSKVPVPVSAGFAAVSTSFNHSAEPPAARTGGAASSEAQEALKRARKIYAKLFDSNAKILGLVSLKDLMNILEDLENPNTGMPELDEQIRYGAGQVKEALQDARREADETIDELDDQIDDAVEDLSGEARQQAADAADLVRTQVVKPLADAVRDIRKAWDELEARLAKEQRIVVPDQIGAITIREIFPELDGGLTALDFALTDSANQSDQIAFALSLGAVYEAGRRFIDALQRSLSNPIARIEDTFRSRFDAVRFVFEGVTQGLPGILRTFLETMIESETEELAEQFVDYILPKSGSQQAPAIALVRLPDLKVYQDALGVDSAVVENLQKAVSLNREDARELLAELISYTLDLDTLADITSDDLDPAQFTRKFLEETDYGQVLADEVEGRGNTIEEAIDAVIAAFKQRTAELEAQLQIVADELKAEIRATIDAIDAAIGEMQALLFTLVTQEIEKIVLAVLTEFSEELVVIADIIIKFDGLRTAAATGEPRTILDASIALIETFTGPLNVSSGKICDEANRAVIPLGRALTYLNPEALILSDPKALGQPIVLTTETISLPAAGRSGRAATVGLELLKVPSPGSPLDSSHPATRVYDAHAKLFSELEKNAAEYSDAIAELDDFKEKAPDLEAEIQDLIAELDGSIRGALADFKGINDTLANTYVSIADADRAAVILRSRLKNIGELDVCASPSELEAKLEAVSRLPQDLEAFADVYETLVNALTRSMGAIGRAVENQIKNGTAYAAIVGVLVAALDRETGLFKRIEDETGEVAETAKAYANNLQRLEFRLTKNIAGILRDVIAPILQQTQSATDFITYIEGLAGDETVRDLINIEGFNENLDQIKLAIGQLQTLDGALAEMSSGSIPDFDPKRPEDQQPAPVGPKLQKLSEEVEKGLSPIAFVSVEISRNENSKTLAELRAFQAVIEAELQNLTVELRQYLQRVETAVLKQADELAKTVLGFDFKVGRETYSLPSFYQKTVEQRANLIANTPTVLAASLQSAVLAAPKSHHDVIDGVYTPAESGGPLSQSNDALAGDAAWLALAANGAPFSDPTQRFFMKRFVSEWADEEAAPFVIGKEVVGIISEILRGDIMRLIDLNTIRSQIEDHLLSLVPSEIQMRYAYGVPLGDPVRKATGGIFAPAKGSRLDIRTGIVIRLNRFEPEIDFSSVGTLGAFDVKLVGDAFDALTLKFKGARFETKGGSKPRFDITYDDYIIGEQLEFVQQLQSILSPTEGSGAFIIPRFGLPGIEAGYSMNLGVFSIGAASFFNIALRTSAILPFGDSDARFRASLSSRSNPFTISYLPFGGSGFFAIEANANGIVGFEASFEFGGAAAFGFGPLTGQGRLMAGVYVRQMTLSNNRKLTEITGTFYVGGSARIWIFGFGASLYVRLGMVNGDMSGEAIFTYSFSIGIKDFDFSIEVWKQEAKGFSGQTSSMDQTGPTRFASLGDAASGGARGQNVALVETQVRSPDTSYAQYRERYFKTPLNSEDYF